METIVGGYSDIKLATKEIQGICDVVKILVEEKTHTIYNVFKAILYRDQIVAGTNYVILVHVGGERYLSLMVYVSLPEEMSTETKLMGVQELTYKDFLEPFNPNI